MKKLIIVLALVLMAGVAQAENISKIEKITISYSEANSILAMLVNDKWTTAYESGKIDKQSYTVGIDVLIRDYKKVLECLALSILIQFDALSKMAMADEISSDNPNLYFKRVVDEYIGLDCWLEVEDEVKKELKIINPY